LRPSVLNERERYILTERRLKGEPVTLEELSQEYDVSRERTRQIEVRAFEKLKKKMRELAAGRGLVPAVLTAPDRVTRAIYR
jgi:RNA polymerase sigma-32 factor